MVLNEYLENLTQIHDLNYGSPGSGTSSIYPEVSTILGPTGSYQESDICGLKWKKRNNSSNSGMPNRTQPEPNRNALERNRLKKIKTGFETLKERLPLSPSRRSKRMSRVEVLRCAMDHIRNLQAMLNIQDLMSPVDSCYSEDIFMNEEENMNFDDKSFHEQLQKQQRLGEASNQQNSVTSSSNDFESNHPQKQLISYNPTRPSSLNLRYLHDINSVTTDTCALFSHSNENGATHFINQLLSPTSINDGFPSPSSYDSEASSISSNGSIPSSNDLYDSGNSEPVTPEDLKLFDTIVESPQYY